MSKFYITPLLVVTIIMFASFALYAQEREDQTSWQDNQVFLPKPDKSGGISLMKALNLRKTSRNISSKDISDRKLSNILWAAAGINRPDGRKTSPTAMNKQEISIVVLTKHGAHIYEPKTHSLIKLISKDIRHIAGKQAFAQKAPVAFVYVADMDKAAGNNAEEKNRYANVDAGFIGQNVYLTCASEGLTSVFLGAIDRDAIKKELQLKPCQQPLFNQVLGIEENKN